MSYEPLGRVIFVSNNQTLRDLVLTAVDRHATSGRQLAVLAQGHGFDITVTTINHLKAGTYKYKPSPETIRAIAWLAGVSESVAFTAAGQPVPGPPLADELPPGSDNLSPKARKALIDLARLLIEYEADNDDAEQQTPSASTNSIPRLRAVAPASNPRPGQKTGLTEAEDSVTPPPIEQLAAHFPFETEHEKFERLHGSRGEENQDPEPGL